jgi:CheY-like chemotaxis protein/HPt (histidine-containing phosphotransfer) domain-containing protein
LAGTGREVLKKLEEKEYDIVLMDMEMPVMDGFTATMEIRKNEKYKDFPIIALTAHAMMEHRKKTLEAGCTDYLSKPVNREKLVEVLSRYIRPKSRSTTTKEKFVSAENSEDDLMMKELTQFFISDLGQRMEQFTHDIANKNLEEVVRFGHSLKGTGGSYGFPEFSKIGSEIEKEGKEGSWERIKILHKKLIEEYNELKA